MSWGFHVVYLVIAISTHGFYSGGWTKPGHGITRVSTTYVPMRIINVSIIGDFLTAGISFTPSTH